MTASHEKESTTKGIEKIQEIDCPCETCKLFQGTKTFTPKNPMLLGRGSQEPHGILFLGQNPGQEEDRQGEVFVGASGTELQATIKNCGIPSKLCHFDNIVKCTTEGNEAPSSFSITCCRTLLDLILLKLKPKVIVPLGNLALKAIAKKAGIRVHRGTILSVKLNYQEKDVFIVPTYHPAYCLRYPQYFGTFQSDIALAYKVFKGENKTTDTKYTLYKEEDLPQFQNYLATSLSVAIDIETKRLNPYHSQAKIISIAFSHTAGGGWAIPLYHKDTYLGTKALKIILLFLKKYLENPKYKKVFHNAQFDALYIKEKLFDWPTSNFLISPTDEIVKDDNGTPIHTRQPLPPQNWKYKPIAIKGIVDDTLLKHYCGVSEEDLHALKPLALQYTNIGNYDKKVDTYFVGVPANQKDYEYHIPLPELLTYNAGDVDATIRLNNLWKKDIKLSQVEKIYSFIIDTIPFFVAIRQIGIKIDLTICRSYSQSLQTEKDKLFSELMSLPPVREAVALRIEDREQKKKAKRTWTFGSSQALDYLFSKILQYPIVKLTKKKAPCYDQEVLQTYTSSGCIVSAKLLDYRKIGKELSMYSLEKVETWLDKKGFAHPQFKIHGTLTGRLASVSPNFQNFPRNGKAKRMIISRWGRKGCIIEADLKQNELRGIAHATKEQGMIDSFLQGRDAHADGAREMFGYSIQSWKELKVTQPEAFKKLRSEFKTIAFGIPYGCGPSVVAIKLWEANDRPMGGWQQFLEIAQEKTELFYRKNKNVKKWIKIVQNIATQKLYVRSHYNRKRRLTQILSADKEVRQEALRKAINFPIQSWSSDICLIGAYRIYHFLEKEKMPACIIGLVHDSIVIDCQTKYMQEIACIMKYIMERPPRPLVVPVEVDIAIGESWGSKLEIDILPIYAQWESSIDYKDLLKKVTYDDWGKPPSDEIVL